MKQRDNGIIRVAIILAVIIILDQITKIFIKTNFYQGESIPVLANFFSITYVRNTGAAFGFLASAGEIVRKIFLLGAPIIFGVWLGRMIWLSRNNAVFLNTGYTLILAGGIGNLIDRIAYGYVVDFLDCFYGTYHWPAFNVADSSITIGAAVLIVDLVFFHKAESLASTDGPVAENDKGQ
ncbi:MAG: signal peptidase II [Bdellovibrionales bacterium RIFOXYD12_FULL_39_22]|nr:MAG: signal peptidase II [Bdellovibrionales bacterium RIFOXYB1_FULL_39_21]OFZ45245.1 MAG: signal peptidase II [Bdellovibrionales bacterium RIFOXYC12_FULL_39_17]OFZ45565.1 MAG: signal peptidase II [Bdellovibrionales bacterium RIFOXYC1_FULL_39_130]OFZ77426.1 MAG: signal peptidase II [Bdellovibrionales bacterium RIFOXYD1_FULL_39_84]OFZ91555.1 MAG: signal peptidase II [Bdellovibrionales bacterium RIFOXYD12_FULL_39_22]HLE11987.1 signal peptidase II [Bacteriovoracaceae bacterium]